MCNVTTGLTLFVALITQVLATAQFDFDFTQLKNDRGLLSDNTCCSGTINDGYCTDHCLTLFEICLTHYQRDVDPSSSCTFASEITQTFTTSTIQFQDLQNWELYKWPNALPIQDMAWPGDFSFIITAKHQSSNRELETIGQYTYSGAISPGENKMALLNDTEGGRAQLQLSWSLFCEEDYYGSDCNTKCQPRNDELGHYECGPNGTRLCRQGWQGTYCDKAMCLDGCSSEHGSCKQPNECVCASGWEGPYCNQCKTYPGCDNGYCEDKFECKCFEGWGGAFCNQDLEYCANKQPCQNGGTCSNSGEGSYTCTCPLGYSGRDCEREETICSVDTCQNGGTCQDAGNDFECHCPAGFSGRQCQTVGIQYCSNQPCENGATCEPIGDSFRCLCSAGWTGKYCQQNVNECNSNPCENGATCIDEDNGYRCNCVSGFSGTTCSTDQNECEVNPCRNGGTCVDGPGSYECRCVQGFYGSLCEIEVYECSIGPCANGGTCIDKINDFECRCAPGYTGRYCGEQINECASSPCRNGATCADQHNGFKCYCPPNYEGNRCQHPFGSAPSSSSTTHRRPISSPVTTSLPEVGPIMSSQSPQNEVEFTQTQFVLIVVFGSAVPIILLLICVSLILYRRFKRRVYDEDSEESEQNEINSMNNRALVVTPTAKYENEYEYPTAAKILTDVEQKTIAPHQIPLDYKNEATAQQNKVVHKDLIKNINSHADRQRKSNNNSTVTQSPRRPLAEPRDALQYYQTYTDSIYQTPEPTHLCHQRHPELTHADGTSVSAAVSYQQRDPTYSVENNMYRGQPFSVTDV